MGSRKKVEKSGLVSARVLSRDTEEMKAKLLGQLKVLSRDTEKSGLVRSRVS
jgi:hypothetical protein